VFVNWGAINWLPDIRRWAEIVAHFLNPGGELYLAEGHPCAHVFDDEKRLPDGMPVTAFPILWVNRFASTMRATMRTPRRA